MAGSDTFRGISFQAAYAVGLALDVLEGTGETLVLEGAEDVVDAGILDGRREPTLTVQAKTKIEPYSWAPAEISEVLQSWLETSPSPTSRFEFASDGSLGPGVFEELRPALQRLGEGALSLEDRDYLKKKGLDPTNEALGRVAIKSRLPAGRELLEQATLRFLALHERVSQMGVEQARDVIFRLFGETVLGSGELTPSSRELSRRQIAELVGIPVETIDAAAAWSEEIEGRYREALKEIPLGPAWTLLNMLEAERPPALAFMKAGDGGGPGPPVPALDLLDLGHNLSLVGPAGSGKTTTLAQLRAAALERGLLPISLRLPSYDGRFEQAVARSVEGALEAPLAPGVPSSLLRREDVVIFLDGVTELVPDQRRALLDDVRTLATSGAKARFIFAGRDANAFSPTTTTYSLVGLLPETRREIAASLLDDSEKAVRDIEEHLGNLADNPLLFSMALALNAQGVSASSRSEIFDGFLVGLEHREEGERLSFAGRACLEVACYELLGEDRYSAEEWWWIERFSKARQELIEKGTIAEDTEAAEELVLEIKRLGLLQAISGTPEIGLLHDLFCDWLASGAIHRDHRVLPDPVPHAYEEAAALLSEHGEMTEAQILAVAASITAASRVADAMPASPIEPTLADRIWRRLATQFGDDLAEHLGALHLHCRTTSPKIAYLAAAEPGDAVDHLSEASLSCVPVGEASSLSVAVDLWMAAIRLELNRRVWEVSPPVPEDAAGLAREMEMVADRREAAFTSLLERLAPSLIDRAQEAVPGSAILGWVLPAAEYPGVSGTGDMIRDHKVVYRHTTGTTHIEPVESEDEVPDLNEAGWMTASGYVRERPSAYAKKQVRTAFSRLMRRFDG